MLEISNLRKEYPGTLALDDVSVSFSAGSVHALLGKNGAGKSTLVKILAGATQPTSGRIYVDGRETKLRSPLDAFRQGIAPVYQELSILPELSVGENIFVGRLPKKKGTGGLVIDWPQLFETANSVLQDMQVSLDVRQKASELGVAQQQVVELAKAMSFKPSVLLLDEPTSALAHHEVNRLFSLLRMLASRGVSIIYITHRLHEVHEIADKITVLRDGKHIGTILAKDAAPATVVKMMFGEIPSREKSVEELKKRETVMEVRNFRREGRFSGVNLNLYKGEILGIAGMLGSGRTELVRAIFGADPVESGEIKIGGTLLRSFTPASMKRLGVAYASENRKEEGLAQLLSTRLNMCLASYDKVSRNGFLTRKMEAGVVRRFVRELDIKISDAEQSISHLSGGNQQKVLLAKWLNTNPGVILLDEPTRGIDIQTKQQIFQIMTDLGRSGISIIFVSTELEELLEVCHRILIMKKGNIVGEVRPAEISADELFVLCMEQ